MGERKVLNKYIPPDFDPAKVPRGKRPADGQIKVRMMLPMSICCQTCGNFISKGTKFNSRKEDAKGETYLGLRIFRFYFRCPRCSGEIAMKTAQIDQAIQKDDILSQKNINIKESDALLRLSGGDGRKLLNVFELVVNTQNTTDITITNDLVMESAQENIALYDKSGEQHYDIISAFIKSIRGSDPNAAVYWLARMLEGGEDIKFIARRLIILASEDIGNANPTALIMANNCFQSVNVIGMPEARIILSQTAIYLASSPKSNSSYMAINEAQEMVRTKGALSVPLELRNAPTKLMKDLDYGKEYAYAHNYTNNFVEQEFLPDGIKGEVFYNPGDNEREKQIRKFLNSRWNDKYNY